MTELIEVRMKLTTERREELLAAMLMHTREYKTLEAEKAVQTSEFNAKMKNARTEMERLAETIEQGYESRRIECLVLYDTPEPNVKTFIDPLSNEPVKTAEMSDDEKRQHRLNFNE